jgi:iron only hydrogenase large subunit-like protein
VSCHTSQDFYNTEENSTEVDLVLSTTELWRLLESLAASPPSPTRRASKCAADVDQDSDELITAVVKKARLCESEGACTAGACEKMQECTSLEEGGPEIAVEVGEMSVGAYLSSLRPDEPRGRDAVEAMMRSVSADGRAFAAAADRNSGSGGYAEYLFKYAAEALYGVNLWGLQDLPYKEGRNADIAEIDINAVSADASSAVGAPARKLKFARAYGFRNIQSIMLKVRRGTCDYDFVEIMACPSGCNNGGGQLRQAAGMSDLTAPGAESSSAKESPAQAKERVAEVEAVHHASLQVRKPEDSPLARYLYSTGRVGAPMSEAAMRLLHTRFHAVPKLDVIAPLATKW